MFLKDHKEGLPQYIDSHFLKSADCYRGLEQLIYDTIDEYFVNLDHKNHTISPSSSHNQSNDPQRRRLNQLCH